MLPEIYADQAILMPKFEQRNKHPLTSNKCPLLDSNKQAPRSLIGALTV